MHLLSKKSLIFKTLFKDVCYFSNSLAILGRKRGNTRSFSTTSCGYSLRPGRLEGPSYASIDSRSYHFDTHKLVTTLEANGFTRQQAEAMTTCVLDVMNTGISNIESINASKIEQERLEMKLQMSINEIKKEMFLLEQSKFAQIKEENQRLKDQVKAIEKLLVEEVSKLKTSTKLDLSLEKSLTREELAFRDQNIKDNGNKIETEIAKLGTLMETQKLDLIKYLVASLLSVTTVGLAFWRFLKM